MGHHQGQQQKWKTKKSNKAMKQIGNFCEEQSWYSHGTLLLLFLETSLKHKNSNIESELWGVFLYLVRNIFEHFYRWHFNYCTPASTAPAQRYSSQWRHMYACTCAQNRVLRLTKSQINSKTTLTVSKIFEHFKFITALKLMHYVSLSVADWIKLMNSASLVQQHV